MYENGKRGSRRAAAQLSQPEANALHLVLVNHYLRVAISFFMRTGNIIVWGQNKIMDLLDLAAGMEVVDDTTYSTLPRGPSGSFGKRRQYDVVSRS